MFGLSAKVGVAGGDSLRWAAVISSRYDSHQRGDDKVRALNVAAAYVIPLRASVLAVKAFAGYATALKAWKDTENVVYNGYQVYHWSASQLLNLSFVLT